MLQQLLKQRSASQLHCIYSFLSQWTLKKSMVTVSLLININYERGSLERRRTGKLRCFTALQYFCCCFNSTSLSCMVCAKICSFPRLFSSLTSPFSEVTETIPKAMRNYPSCTTQSLLELISFQNLTNIKKILCATKPVSFPGKKRGEKP